MYRFDRTFWIAAVILAVLSAPGLVLYVRQLVLGLGVTDLNRPVFSGRLFWSISSLEIGVSMAGTVISAVLQLLNVKWRRPITRIAEALTVFGLLIAGLQILMDMGRPDRFLYTLVPGRFEVPLLWDILSLMLYLLTAIFALYLQLLPDLALLRGNVPAGAPEWRRKMYEFFGDEVERQQPAISDAEKVHHRHFLRHCSYRSFFAHRHLLVVFHHGPTGLEIDHLQS